MSTQEICDAAHTAWVAERKLGTLLKATGREGMAQAAYDRATECARVEGEYA